MITPEIRGVIFDLGKVLIDVDFSDSILGLFTKGALESKQRVEHLYQHSLFREYNCGRISSKMFYEEVNRQYHLNLDYEDFKEKWCSIFQPLPGMEELVKRLAAHYKVGLLSDTDPLHWHYCLTQFPFLKIFTKPALSYEIGQIKPAEECYFSAAENIGLKPQQCLFIDDRQENVRGAQKTGMQALLFSSPQKLLEDLQSLINI